MKLNNLTETNILNLHDAEIPDSERQQLLEYIYQLTPQEENTFITYVAQLKANGMWTDYITVLTCMKIVYPDVFAKIEVSPSEFAPVMKHLNPETDFENLDYHLDPLGSMPDLWKILLLYPYQLPSMLQYNNLRRIFGALASNTLAPGFVLSEYNRLNHLFTLYVLLKGNPSPQLSDYYTWEQVVDSIGELELVPTTLAYAKIFFPNQVNWKALLSLKETSASELIIYLNQFRYSSSTMYHYFSQLLDLMLIICDKVVVDEPGIRLEFNPQDETASSGNAMFLPAQIVY